MSIVFEPITHSYTSLDIEDKTKWVSVTTLIGALKQPFNSNEVAKRCSLSNKPTNKWKGMSVSDIQQAWKNEADRACTLGNWYHDQREQDMLECNSIVRENTSLPIVKSITDDNGRKIAPVQKIVNGVYPEHMVYLKSSGICGQSDLVEVINDRLNIIDYKTNKEIKSESFINWEGVSNKMLGPLSHLDDCNLNHYNIQLSIYMYIILKHNPNLKPGKVIIHHITFEEEEEKDKYGYPITKLDNQGDPIINNIEIIELPYLKKEVIDVLKWYEINKDKIKKK